jgi:hypothetical protein
MAPPISEYVNTSIARAREKGEYVNTGTAWTGVEYDFFGHLSGAQ